MSSNLEPSLGEAEESLTVIYENGCRLEKAEVEPKVCTVGSDESAPSVVLFGDEKLPNRSELFVLEDTPNVLDPSYMPFSESERCGYLGNYTRDPSTDLRGASEVGGLAGL